LVQAGIPNVTITDLTSGRVYRRDELSLLQAEARMRFERGLALTWWYYRICRSGSPPRAHAGSSRSGSPCLAVRTLQAPDLTASARRAAASSFRHLREGHPERLPPSDTSSTNSAAPADTSAPRLEGTNRPGQATYTCRATR
jgi:hypothetical protein